MKKQILFFTLRLCLYLTFPICVQACSSGSNDDDPTTDKQVAETMTITKTEYNVNGNITKITIDVDATGTYTISSNASWITPSSSSSNEKSLNVTLKENGSYMPRNGQLTFKMGKLSQNVKINQKGKYVFIDSNKEGMNNNAKTLISKIKMGWNLGNNMEAYYDNCDPLQTETSWGNPKTTEAMIKAVKNAGFNAIRIPVRWYPHIDSEANFNVSESWMKRVKEIVDYCISNGMYAIVNTHHENWLESHALYADSAEVHKKENALWKQIAVNFRDYDEHLIFAGTNEVHIENNWNAPTKENAEVQNLFNQWFIDAVRETGGKNTYRTLVVQTYATNPTYGLNSLIIPKDPTPERLAIEYHFYDPNDYCLEDKVKFWGKDYQSYGISSWGQEDHMDDLFNKMKAKFTDNGYPLILGEFGVVNHSFTDEQKESGIQCRAAYLKRVVSTAHKIGAAPFLWDNGGTGAGTECFGYFDRKDNMRITDETAIKAMAEGAETAYPY